ncbi:MAG: hypothetical protein COT84_06945 [Chlamydiae bacterium CG10_big_fil_rev_8_21_14_0_10_35_9]|nr:MAG: hypothetical protein COT84_06945 [Chlamydiae bacterium CG10_big_fil_rev_8_21_14_0_10_35_9]
MKFIDIISPLHSAITTGIFSVGYMLVESSANKIDSFCEKTPAFVEITQEAYALYHEDKSFKVMIDSGYAMFKNLFPRISVFKEYIENPFETSQSLQDTCELVTPIVRSTKILCLSLLVTSALVCLTSSFRAYNLHKTQKIEKEDSDAKALLIN